MRPVLVGEANPYGGDPGYALWPEPRGCSGWRLCHTILGMDQHDYLRAFDRVNLCHQNWTLRAAREGVAEVLRKYDGPLVLLGSRVCLAFRVKYDPFTKEVLVDAISRPGFVNPRRVMILPHPSGLSRAWNEEGAAGRARTMVKELRATCE